MKHLLLIRHAKSSWADAGMDDFDRPLNERGKTDAPGMAKRLLAKDVQIDLFICSTAKRAQRTCKLIMDELGIGNDHLLLIPQLYLAPPEIFEQCISKVDNKYKTIAIIAHNPGITDFANRLTPVKIDDMPTCAVYAAKIDTNDWKKFFSSKKEFWFFDYPKNLS
jgi:phosphohistidine phosphatase